MCLGYAARCKKELKDEKTVLYSYHVENWNLPHEQAECLEAVEGGIAIDGLSGVDQWERDQGEQYTRCPMHILMAKYERYMEEGQLPDTATFTQ